MDKLQLQRSYVNVDSADARSPEYRVAAVTINEHKVFCSNYHRPNNCTILFDGTPKIIATFGKFFWFLGKRI
ncbi:MAG: hypothetical protein OEZ35_09015 [Candidatus Bathyarchaeota archaeon]|nr:hypothetical protein [Candidatus Bathyarchaeota archaeon]